jgi:hypothetical protein
MHVRFGHKNQIVCGAEFFREELYPGAPIGLGSELMRKVFFDTKDERFAAYRTQKQMGGSLGLDDAVQVAANFIRACSDPAALEVDPYTCAAIGGHIHIATITPRNGFRWVYGFEPIPDDLPSRPRSNESTHI